MDLGFSTISEMTLLVKQVLGNELLSKALSESKIWEISERGEPAYVSS